MQLLPHHSPGTSYTQQNVVIDFSSLQQEEANSGDFSVATIVEWVRSYPRKGSVHVYLPSDHVLSNSRQLQSTLLSLGCTVTRRLPMCHN